MESLPSFRVDTGRVRIIFGLTMSDIAVVVVVWLTVYLLWPNWLTLLGGLVAGRSVVTGTRLLKRLIPAYALRQLVGWLGQANYYEPGPDPEPTPIFPQAEP